MAERVFKVDVDFAKNRLLNPAVHSGTSFPQSPVVGQLFYRLDENVLYVCTDASVPTWTSCLYGGGGGSGHIGFEGIFKGRGPSIDKTAWKVLGSFIYDGTDSWTPSQMKAVLSVEHANGKHHNLRLCDLVKGTVICELGDTVLTKDAAVYSQSTFSNLPSSESVIEIQGKKVESSAKKGHLHSIRLES